MENTNGYELGWDSPIENDSPEFILLPDGEAAAFGYDLVEPSEIIFLRRADL